jgi:predicted TIM-barrel fold metal-dependent hydrolase
VCQSARQPIDRKETVVPEAKHPPRLIVDSQVHIWKAETPDRPWVPGRPPQLPEPLTYDRLLPMMDEAGVDRVIIVPPSWEGERNDYALEAAARFPHRFAVMGRLSLLNPKAAQLLMRWKEQAGMLGVRLTFHEKQLALLTEGTADWFWPAAEKAGLPVMVLGGIKSEFGRIAERHPGLSLILDHMGLLKGMVTNGTIARNIDETVALARFPNVSVKVSAAPTYSTQNYPFADMNDHIRKVVEAFGPRRCYWGTDMTNSFHKANYRQRVAHFTDELQFLSEDDTDWIMGRAILQQLGWE